MVFLSLLPSSLNGGLSNHWLSWANTCRTIYSNYLLLTKMSNYLFSSWEPRNLRVNWAQENRTNYYLRNSNYLSSSWEPRKLRVNRVQANRTSYSYYLLLEKSRIIFSVISISVVKCCQAGTVQVNPERSGQTKRRLSGHSWLARPGTW